MLHYAIILEVAVSSQATSDECPYYLYVIELTVALRKEQAPQSILLADLSQPLSLLHKVRLSSQASSSATFVGEAYPIVP